MTYSHRLRALVALSAAVMLAACASKSGKVTQESAGSVASSAAGSAAGSAASTTTALSGALGPASALIGGLTKSIPGLSQAQAILGAGSIFGLAKAKMPGDQFSQLASAVPGTQALVDEATKAGITSGMVSQLVPALANAVSAGGGQGLADAFLAAVK